LLAVGDINLGRTVGQEILKGDTLFPFRFVRDTLLKYDIVFGNLESQLSDQHGETQHPRNNLIFTGPPPGAHSLKKGGFTVVSTANNHALDYGLKAHGETISNLAGAGVTFVGTAADESHLFEPVLFTSRGIRFALFACTGVMNMEDGIWRRYVTPADTAQLFPRIRAYRSEVDFLILSYHGGEEYSKGPTEQTQRFAHAAVGAGVDLFLGHHPHVPHGLEEIDGKCIVYSLGNFVFRQHFHEWTQRSFAFEATIEKQLSGARVREFRCLPLIADVQPRFLGKSSEAAVIMNRVRSLSTIQHEKVAWLE
jgi:poly-gamma-glutamate synthesis protein (capsule biosynthesis protein)